MSDTITCAVCGAEIHHVGHHLKTEHPEISIDDYRAQFPDAPLVSKIMQAKLEEHQLKMQMQTASVTTLPVAEVRQPMADLFGLGDHPLSKNAKGEQTHVTVLGQHHYQTMVPDRDPGYVFDVDMLKTCLFALETNIPLYLWGYHGTGKSSMIDQVCCYTNRPLYRVQHTLNMVESDVVGDWRAKDGDTYFDLGPLPLAMMHGWTFLADEYDRAPPGVIALYQAVLEGKPLVIKEAPPEHRVIRPHKNFRFTATGNTNGSGDETGLYSGTLIQDAASYSRFGVTMRVKYMEPEAEQALLMAKIKLNKDHAVALTDWANKIREAFDAGKISSTIGPRELLYAAKIGAAFMDFRKGLDLAIVNRMTDVDREVASELAQRIFGN
jgi:cobaltochelatase CobS